MKSEGVRLSKGSLASLALGLASMSVMVLSTETWSPPLFPSCMRPQTMAMSATKTSTKETSFDGSFGNRRRFVAAFVGGSLLWRTASSPCTASEATANDATTNAVDPWDKFGQSLQQQQQQQPMPQSVSTPKWPETSASPLPRTMDSIPSSSSASEYGSNSSNGNDLERAIQESKKRRQVDPRTHG